ncbi:tRNA nucleotidyltransferase/poly(A) polymerase family protein [Coleofasciculus chthonoplastes PCC 7420]|uniref:tRNA nucleotidyltransferase/poly(A) polymerase family protein n=1 Tax=Coleofasciculus chthonoplastes PCC 7420 TaxID=118168 RepID=B4VIS8_9CYAN|nr:CCA tRNA nucleotidyltransferase [Coleofasciculus chthonoplastes]EDX78206.1 tRNA nucleotidyltransferase/poly(A) polymerase family protein [Coleofasciculus chthonoplastes PCC 7420]
MNSDLSVLSPERFPFSLEWLPPQACLVGGAVRDALLRRQADYLDLDFVVPHEAVKVARKLASHYKAGFVVLDEARQIARVVFDTATVDIAQQEGETLETDLYRRDFTINAIAYNPQTQQIIDPLQGVADCRAGIIRMVSPANLQDDPLRLLRAYRQAAQLGFTIESTTQSTIRQLAPLLANIAAERVQVELNYLLQSPQGTPWLTAAWQDQLLHHWFPDTKADNFTQIAATDNAASVLAQTWQTLASQLKTPVSGKSLSWLSLAKLTNVLPSEVEPAQAKLLQLKYSRAEIRAVLIMIQYLPQLLSHVTSPMSLREQYFFFQAVGSVFPALAVLAVAEGVSVESIAPLTNRYLNPEDQVSHPTPLVTGHDLIQQLKLPPSPQIGELLTEIQIARIEGKVSTRDEALAFAKQLI